MRVRTWVLLAAGFAAIAVAAASVVLVLRQRAEHRLEIVESAADGLRMPAGSVENLSARFVRDGLVCISAACPIVRREWAVPVGHNADTKMASEVLTAAGYHIEAADPASCTVELHSRCGASGVNGAIRADIAVMASPESSGAGPDRMWRTVLITVQVR